jgi:hypothetical protein
MTKRRLAALAALAASLSVTPAGAQDLSHIHNTEPTRLGMISYAVVCL